VRSHDHSNFASCSTSAKKGDSICGRARNQQWIIKETRVGGRFTFVVDFIPFLSQIDILKSLLSLSLTDSQLFWGFIDGEIDTPVRHISILSLDGDLFASFNSSPSGVCRTIPRINGSSLRCLDDDRGVFTCQICCTNSHRSLMVSTCDICTLVWFSFHAFLVASIAAVDNHPQDSKRPQTIRRNVKWRMSGVNSNVNCWWPTT